MTPPPLADFAHPTEGWLTFPDVARGVVLVAILVGLGILVFLRTPAARRLAEASRKWLLFMALLIIPITIVFAGNYFAMEEFKEVQSCMGCHQMEPFGADMLEDRRSTTLAALHHQKGWIAKDACYSCHTGYGVTGTVQSKMDGLRHLYGRVTGDYERPIRFRGTFPNANCLDCHLGARGYESVQVHRGLHELIVADQISCLRCHGRAHPSFHDRRHPPVRMVRGEAR